MAIVGEKKSEMRRKRRERELKGDKGEVHKMMVKGKWKRRKRNGGENRKKKKLTRRKRKRKRKEK